MTEFKNNLRTGDQVLDTVKGRRALVDRTPREKSRGVSLTYDGTASSRYADVMELRLIVNGEPEEHPPVDGVPPEIENAQPLPTGKLAWHPIDVGGLRLYRVVGTWPKDWNLPSGKTRSHYIAAGKTPTDAVERVRRTFGDSASPDLKGFPLDVLQPAAWWNEGIPQIE